jgi:BirA family biotin operon repressor/biotin-[acetyl-CoA-carboxylase] ligase
VTGPNPRLPPVPPVLVFDSLDSTNAEACRRVEAGEAGPLWIAARSQTAGRGRRGRNWRTDQGNLAATLLMRTQRPPADAARVAFVAALAVYDLIEAYAPLGSVRLKWPNDVLLAGRKVSGILIESGPLKEGGGLWLAIGIGVNLSHAPQGLERPATALAAHLGETHLVPPAFEDALQHLAKAFEVWRGTWDAQGFEAIASAWTARAVGMGETCVVRLDQETFGGVAEGLDPDGALRLRTADGALRRVHAGDVFFGEG